MSGICSRTLGLLCFAASYLVGVFQGVPPFARIGRGLVVLLGGLLLGAVIGSILERTILRTWADDRGEDA